MRGVNKVIIVGRAGSDVDIRYTPSGVAIANLNLATSESWKGQDGQVQERTEWHRIVMYRRLAEIAGEYVKKGSKLYIEGKLQTRKWKDKDGQDRYTTEINVQEMQMLDGKPEGHGGSKAGSQGRGVPQANHQNHHATSTNGGDFGDVPPEFDDGIPF